MPTNHKVQKHDRELRKAAKRAAKLARKEARRFDANGQFESAWPDPPEPLAGIARTLSRGLE